VSALVIGLPNDTKVDFGPNNYDDSEAEAQSFRGDNLKAALFQNAERIAALDVVVLYMSSPHFKLKKCFWQKYVNEVPGFSGLVQESSRYVAVVMNK
jgi:hypothetical protein